MTRVTHRVVLSNGEPFEFEREYPSNYREINGVLVKFDSRLSLHANDQLMLFFKNYQELYDWFTSEKTKEELSQAGCTGVVDSRGYWERALRGNLGNRFSYHYTSSSGFSLFEERGSLSIICTGYIFDGTMYLREDSPFLSDPTHEYNFVPDFQFFKEKKLKSDVFFGLELEVNTRIHPQEFLKVIREVEPIQEDFLYLKSDSSISGQHRYNYEVVTHPMHPRRMRREFRTLYSKLDRLLKTKGETIESVFSLGTSTNGIHIHVSRDSFKEPNRDTRFKTSQLTRNRVQKFQYFWNNSSKVNSDFISKLAKRDITRNSYCGPMSIYYGITKSRALKTPPRRDKYHCCRTSHDHTLEVRVFQGDPTLSNILYCIDTVEAVLDFSGQCSYQSIQTHFERHFKTWLSKQQRYPSLRKELLCA